MVFKINGRTYRWDWLKMHPTLLMTLMGIGVVFGAIGFYIGLILASAFLG